MNSNSYGCDFGSYNLKIYQREHDSYLMQHNMVAIQDKKTMLAYGDEAFAMYEKAPANIVTSYPVVNGVIADINNMQTMVKYFITDQMRGNLKPAEYYVAVPTDVTEVEKRAFYDLIKDSGVKAKKIMVVEKAVADGLGLDIDVKNSQGVMIVNVGYATTEISILSLGGIVLSRLIKVGGLKFDEAIRNAIRKEFNLIIGQKSAEKIKMNLRELEKNGESATVYGRDIVTGLPIEKQIPTDLVDACMEEHFRTIIDNIKVILERTPPELGADIYRHGIYLTGGASQVCKFAALVQKNTGLKVNMAQSPIESVTIGLSKIIKDDNYKSLAYSIEGMGK